RNGLESGSVEGRNMVIEARWARCEAAAARTRAGGRHLHRRDPSDPRELLREVSPKISQVALLNNDQNPASVLALKETQEWAKNAAGTIQLLGVHDRASLETAFAAVRSKRPDALMTTADALLASYRSLIVEFASGRRLISMSGDRD